MCVFDSKQPYQLKLIHIGRSLAYFDDLFLLVSSSMFLLLFMAQPTVSFMFESLC